MPVKDPGDFLTPCLDSILDQTHQNWELLAVDDHSSDHSLDTLKSYAAKDARIRVGSNQGRGIVPALQMGYRMATGTVVSRMDSDDLMPPQKLEMMLAALEAGTVVTGKVAYFSDEWMVGLGFRNYERWLNTLVVEGGHWRDIYKECPVPSPAWMMHRADFDSIGGFDSPELPEDYDLCFRMKAGKMQVIGVDAVVHHWRDSQWRTSRTDSTYFPMAYYPLKVKWFLQLDYQPDKDLMVWGAGKKGKLIARLLFEHGIPFRWVTDNENKHGVTIQKSIPEPVFPLNPMDHHVILAVASPEDQREIQHRLDQMGMVVGQDAWWFC